MSYESSVVQKKARDPEIEVSSDEGKDFRRKSATVQDAGMRTMGTVQDAGPRPGRFSSDAPDSGEQLRPFSDKAEDDGSDNPRRRRSP
jgi:hypothetical protein